MAGIDVRSEMSRHCSGVIGDHDESVLLSPKEELGIAHAEREVDVLPYASNLKRVGAFGRWHVRVPPKAARVDSRQGGTATPWIRLDRLRPPSSLRAFQLLSQLGYAGRMRADAAEMIQLRLIVRHVTVDFISVVEIKRNDLVDGSQFQCGELAKNHLGRETLIIIIDEVVESDPVPDQADFPVGVPVQAVGQQRDQRLEEEHQWPSLAGGIGLHLANAGWDHAEAGFPL